MVPNPHLSYLMKVTGAAMAVCVVSHRNASYRDLQKEQMIKEGGRG